MVSFFQPERVELKERSGQITSSARLGERELAGGLAKQALPFKLCRREEWIAPVNLVSDVGMPECHQADRCLEHWVWTLRTNQPVVEGAPIEGLMLCADGDQEMVGIVVLRRHPAEPQG